MAETDRKVQTVENGIAIPEVSKILLVIRNNIDYIKATRNAISLASGRNPVIYLLYAVDMELPPVVSEDVEKEVYTKLKAEGEQIVNECIEMIKNSGIRTEIAGMHFGFAAERILKTEKEIKPDLIVLSSRGLSTLKKLLLGSVSDEVTKEAKAPVLLVK